MSEVPNYASGSTPRWLAIAEEEFVPADSGGRVESLNLLHAAVTARVRLHVVVPGLAATDEAGHRAALPGSRLEGIPRRTGWRSHASLSPYLFVSRPLPPGLADRLRTEHARDPYDAVVSTSFRVAHIGVALAAALDLPLLVRPHNIESEYFSEVARAAAFPRNLPYLAEAWKLRRAEAAVHASPRVTLFADIAERDAARRARLTSAPVLHVPPFIRPRPAVVTVGPGRPARARTVLFLGALDSPINREGIRWFVDECWPGLRADLPGVDLHVVGRRAPDGFPEELHAAGVRVTVDAPDVTPLLAAADVFVNPVRQGAGVNIKMVEAMTAGLPVVTTTTGARGMHWRNGEHLVVADKPAAFRVAVGQLLRDPDRRARLGAAARCFIADELDGVRHINRLRAALEGRWANARDKSGFGAD